MTWYEISYQEQLNGPMKKKAFFEWENAEEFALEREEFGMDVIGVEWTIKDGKRESRVIPFL